MQPAQPPIWNIARSRVESALVETVPRRLGAHGLQQDLAHGRDAAARAQRLLDVELVVVEQAQVELAVGGEAHAVAGPAVRLAHRRDEADHAVAAVGEAEVAGLVGRARARQRLERRRAPPRSAAASRRSGTNCDRATCAVSPPPSGISSMKRTCQPRSRAQPRELHHVGVVVVARHGAVELDRHAARPPRPRRCPPRTSSTEAKRISFFSRSGSSVSRCTLSRPQPGLAQRAREAREQDAVRGHREVRDAVDRRDAAT